MLQPCLITHIYPFILMCNLLQQILMQVKVVVVIFHVFKKDRFLVKTGDLNILIECKNR